MLACAARVTASLSKLDVLVFLSTCLEHDFSVLEACPTWYWWCHDDDDDDDGGGGGDDDAASLFSTE